MERARTRSRLPLLVSALLAAVGVAAIAFSSATGPDSDAERRVDGVAVQSQDRSATPGRNDAAAGGRDALACPDDLRPVDSIARLRKLREPVDEPHASSALERPALEPHVYAVPIKPQPAPDETARERILRALRVGPDDTPFPETEVELRVPGCDH